jgi:hypothetical protein
MRDLNPMPVEPVRLAYLAGLIDGEGCITMRHFLRHSASGKYGPGRQNSMGARVEIHTVSPRMIEAIRAILADMGLSCTIEKPKYQPMSTRPAIRLMVHNKHHVRHLLRSVLPYLVVKQPEAELVLEFLDRACAVPRYRIVQEDYEIRAALPDLKRHA